jgi:putative spermidine/putrescine transport system ATP-binding protein
MNRGRVEQTGSPEDIYERPATRFVADFVGRANILPATRSADGRLTLWGTALPVAAPPAGEIDIFVRPQRIRLAPVSEPAAEGVARIRGQVSHSVFIGDRIEVVVEGAGGQLSIEMPSGQRPPAEGTEVAAIWPVEDTLVFPREAP